MSKSNLRSVFLSSILDQKRVIWLLTGVLLTSVGCASKPPALIDNLAQGDYDNVKQQMRWFIQQQMDEHDVVGLSIALVDDQKIIWQEGFGYADKANKTPASSDTIYRAGSVSKLFNAIATMQLHEQGRLDIDQPLARYLPEFTINSRPGHVDHPRESITLRSLITHHSGLPGDWNADIAKSNPDPFSVLPRLIKDEYLAYAPNEVFSYSNLGITLLGDAIQKVAAMPYVKLLQNHVLRPLGMPSSQFAQALSGGMTGSLVGQQASLAYIDGELVEEIPLRDIPAGGLNSSVVDLSRLAMMVNGGGVVGGQRILDKPTLDAMFVKQSLATERDQLAMQTGLGWLLDDAALGGAEMVYGHGGSTIAHEAHFTIAPQSKLAVVVLANTASAPVRRIANKILQQAWQAKTGKGFIVPILEPHSQTSDFSGTYVGLLGKLDIRKLSEGHFRAKTASGQIDLKQAKDGRYYAKYRMFGLLPVKMGGLSEVGFYTDTIAGYQVIVGEDQAARAIAGMRVHPTPIDPEWTLRLGRYSLLKPEAEHLLDVEVLALRIEDGYLLADYFESGEEGKASTEVLRSAGPNIAVREGLGRGYQEVIRVVQKDGLEMLSYNGLLFEKRS